MFCEKCLKKPVNWSFLIPSFCTKCGNLNVYILNDFLCKTLLKLNWHFNIRKLNYVIIWASPKQEKISEKYQPMPLWNNSACWMLLMIPSSTKGSPFPGHFLVRACSNFVWMAASNQMLSRMGHLKQTICFPSCQYLPSRSIGNIKNMCKLKK